MSEGEAKSNDGEKVWSSVHHSILSAAFPSDGRVGRASQNSVLASCLSLSNSFCVPACAATHLIIYQPNINSIKPHGADPLPPSSTVCVAKTGRNLLNEEFTPLLPTGIGERF